MLIVVELSVTKSSICPLLPDASAVNVADTRNQPLPQFFTLVVIPEETFSAVPLDRLKYAISPPKVPPLVFLTSNNTREIGDALKRRCLHLYIPFPDAARENSILQARVPELDATLRGHIVDFVQAVRDMDLKKPPAVSETIDWARTVVLLNMAVLDSDFVKNTLNVLLKFKSDIENVEAELARLMRETQLTPDTPIQ